MVEKWDGQTGSIFPEQSKAATKHHRTRRTEGEINQEVEASLGARDWRDSGRNLVSPEPPLESGGHDQLEPPPESDAREPDEYDRARDRANRS